MVAFILCTACGAGDCDNHVAGQTIRGLLGGWHCPCGHTPAEREQQRERFEARMRKMFRGDADATS